MYIRYCILCIVYCMWTMYSENERCFVQMTGWEWKRCAHSNIAIHFDFDFDSVIVHTSLAIRQHNYISIATVQTEDGRISYFANYFVHHPNEYNSKIFVLYFDLSIIILNWCMIEPTTFNNNKKKKMWLMNRTILFNFGPNQNQIMIYESIANKTAIVKLFSFSMKKKKKHIEKCIKCIKFNKCLMN